MGARGALRRKTAILVKGVVLGTALVAGFAWQPYRLAINTTPSEPEGLYLTRSLAPGAGLYRGELVVMRYEGPATRRYRAVAPYPAGSKFIKRIAGLPGDVLYAIDEEVLLVHAGGYRSTKLGRRLVRSPSGKSVPPGPAWNDARIPPSTYYLASSSSPEAYDSRYFGLVLRKRILAKAWPIWTD